MSNRIALRRARNLGGFDERVLPCLYGGVDPSSDYGHDGVCGRDLAEIEGHQIRERSPGVQRVQCDV